MSDTLERTAKHTATPPIVTCAGSATERGEAHGETLRDLIADGLGRWADAIAEAHGIDTDVYVAAFVKGTDYLQAIRRWTPNLVEEIDGIARGADQRWEWIYAYNLMDEEWAWSKSYGKVGGPGCTVAGFAPADGFPTLAQTMDIPSVHDGTQALLRIKVDDERSTMMFPNAGMIGLSGCNSEGLAVVVNSLDVLPSSRSGLPVAFVIRGILERSTLADAVAFTSDVPHASGQHYGIGAPSGLSSIEAWATGVAVDTNPGTRLLHTNHPLRTEEAECDAEATYRLTRTRERLNYLDREAGAQRDVAGLQNLLKDRSVRLSLGADRSLMTFGAVVYECRVPARMWLAPGPPHGTPFVRIH